MQAALHKLVKPSAMHRERFEAYRKDFSTDALSEHFIQFLMDCIRPSYRS
jgi:hypothetical protein